VTAPLLAGPGIGASGLVTLSPGPGQVHALSPDAVVEYLAAAGRPAVYVPSPAALNACPVLTLAADRGLCRTLTVGLADGTRAEWPELRPAWAARLGDLPPAHPAGRLLTLLPHDPRRILAELVGWLLHPRQARAEAAALPPSAYDRTALLAARLLGGPGAARAYAHGPAGFYARRAAAAGPGGRHAVRAALLDDLGAVWAGGAPAGLASDPDAKRVWDAWTP
jgi:hypothetical protein